MAVMSAAAADSGNDAGLSVDAQAEPRTKHESSMPAGVSSLKGESGPTRLTLGGLFGL